MVFDAAETDHRPPVTAPRGVRVLFSPRGVIADDVIRDLVAAEPAGRVVVVVTADQAVARDVIRDGARVRAARTCCSTCCRALAATRRVGAPGPMSVVPATVPDMTTRIDCDTCTVRGLHCHDCVVTVLLGPPPELTFDDDGAGRSTSWPRAAWCRRCGWSSRSTGRTWSRPDRAGAAGCDWCDCCDFATPVNSGRTRRETSPRHRLKVWRAPRAPPLTCVDSGGRDSGSLGSARSPR